MKILTKIEINKIKEFFKNLSRSLAEHAFLTFLALFFISLIIGGYLFYQYSILAQKVQPKIIREPIQFKEDLYQKILQEWQIRQERFEKADIKEYPNFFQPKLPPKLPSKLPLPHPRLQELLGARHLSEFYIIKGERLPSLEQRAQIWQQLQLGDKEEYEGTYYQNIRLLKELKEELTR